MQQEVASKQPQFDSLAVSAPHLQAAQARMEATATQLNDRYATLKNQAKVQSFKQLYNRPKVQAKRNQSISQLQYWNFVTMTR